jgi:hypothetical protein
VSIEVSISPRVQRGLKVIEHIPPIRPLRLEGRNGIGKSVAIRLTSLVSGRQPYTGDQASWNSLRALVGATEITISGLKGLREEPTAVKVVFTPDTWPDQPETVGEWLGRAYIDGDLVSLKEVFAKFDVAHLVGTEKLIDTVERRRGTIETTLTALVSRLGSMESQRAQLGLLLAEMEDISPAREQKDQERRSEAESDLRGLRLTVQQAQRHVEDLQRASGLAALIAAASSPQRVSELAAAREAAEAAKQELDEAERVLEAAVRSLEQGTQAQKALGSAERRLTRARREQERLLRQWSELRQSLQNDGIAVPPGDTPLDVVDAPLDALLSRLEADRLSMERSAYRSALDSARRAVYDELRVVVDGAVQNGFSDFVVGRLREADLTIAELKAALEEPPEARSSTIVDSALSSLRSAEARVTRLRQLYKELPAASRQATDSAAELERLVGSAPVQDDLQANVIAARRRWETAQQSANETARTLGSLQAGGVDPTRAETAREELERLLVEHSVALDELNEQMTKALAELQLHRGREQQLLDVIGSSEAAAARRRVARRTLGIRLVSDPELAWARPILGISGEDNPPVEAVWPELQSRAAHLLRTANLLVRHLEGLQEAAASNSSEGAHAEAIDALLERDAMADLSQPAIAAALFGGGRVESLDLRRSIVAWKTTSGERVSRPLSAFSSGEQALGFVRARLHQIADTRAENRIIFLDEFGAFISADNRRPLAQLLSGSDLEGISDEAVVVLPLQADYESELSQTTGELRDRYENRAREVAQHGYFTELLIP